MTPTQTTPGITEDAEKAMTKEQFMADHLFRSDAGGYYSCAAEDAWTEYQSYFVAVQAEDVAQKIAPCPYCESADLLTNGDCVLCTCCGLHGPFETIQRTGIDMWNEVASLRQQLATDLSTPKAALVAPEDIETEAKRERIRSQLFAELKPGQFAPKSLIGAIESMERIRSFAHYHSRESLKATGLGENDPAYMPLVEARICREAATALATVRAEAIKECLDIATDYEHPTPQIAERIRSLSTATEGGSNG